MGGADGDRWGTTARCAAHPGHITRCRHGGPNPRAACCRTGRGRQRPAAAPTARARAMAGQLRQDAAGQHGKARHAVGRDRPTLALRMPPWLKLYDHGRLGANAIAAAQSGQQFYQRAAAVFGLFGGNAGPCQTAPETRQTAAALSPRAKTTRVSRHPAPWPGPAAWTRCYPRRVAAPQRSARCATGWRSR